MHKSHASHSAEEPLNSCQREFDLNREVCPLTREIIEQRLLFVAEKAKTFVKDMVSMESHLVGSVALGVFNKDSDIDLAVPVRTVDLRGVLEKLSYITEFRGERRAGPNSTRYLFCTNIDGVHIDINVLTEFDCAYLIKGMREARIAMSDEERLVHAEKKLELKERGDSRLLDIFKLEIYKKYCPNLDWIPDFQIRESLASSSSVPFGCLRLPPS